MLFQAHPTITVGQKPSCECHKGSQIEALLRDIKNIKGMMWGPLWSFPGTEDNDDTATEVNTLLRRSTSGSLLKVILTTFQVLNHPL